MTIEIKRNEKEMTVLLAGRLDTTTAPDLDKAILENLEGVEKLIFDMTSLEYVSSAGLRILLAAQKRMNALGSMELTGVCDTIMEIFEITGFVDVLTIV